MRADVGIKLLQLTKQKTRIGVHELGEHMHAPDTAQLTAELEQLSAAGFITSGDGVIELDATHRIRIAQELIQTGCDPQRISRFLEWQEFEDFTALCLEKNAFTFTKHFVFKTKGRRHEIDLVAWNDTFLLAVDCKHWLRGLSPSQARAIAGAQAERAIALAERPDLLLRLGVRDVERRRAMPVIVCLGNTRSTIVDGVPVVPVSKLISFLYGVSPIDEKIRTIRVRVEPEQAKLS